MRYLNNLQIEETTTVGIVAQPKHIVRKDIARCVRKHWPAHPDEDEAKHQKRPWTEVFCGSPSEVLGSVREKGIRLGVGPEG